MNVHVKKVMVFVFCCMAFTGPIECQKAHTVIPALSEVNKGADLAFLRWKVNSPHSSFSAPLRKLLTPQAMKYLVDKAQMPFDKPLAQDELNKKVAAITDDFLKRYNPKKIKITTRELNQLVRALIYPEYVFLPNPESTDPFEQSYSKLLELLDEHETRAGTTLKEWALRYLTSESITVALPIIERMEVDGKSFDQFSPKEKKKRLSTVVDMVTNRLISNLRALQKKFNLDLPYAADTAIKRKVRSFLAQKFISSL